MQQSFGNWLRLHRKALDLTREALADRVGCSVATIRKLEAEERRPSAQIAERLAQVLRIPLDEREAFVHFARGGVLAAPEEPLEELPWRKQAVSPRVNLPSPTTSLVGREREIAHICGYLADANIRLISLTGPPGIGKTRLSIAAAKTSTPSFPDGVVFVPLATLNDPSLVAVAILQSLGFVEAKNLPVVEQLKVGIGEKHILLVLDNCEHLIDEIAQLVADLLLICSNLKILVTSREALRIPGEWLYAVPTLKTPEEDVPLRLEAVSSYSALALFAERARAVRSDFALSSENLQAVASICAKLDGLPLAIELLAARMRWMSPQALLERMSDEYVLSADGMRAVSARQKTLYNAINWSYGDLPINEQVMLAYLGVFSGGFTLEAAEGMYSLDFPGKPVLNLLTSLSDKSLLQRRIDAQSESRFFMLLTIKQFALQKLRQTGNESAARERHLSYFLGLAEAGAVEMRGPRQVDWGNHLESEHANFRAALEWGIANRKTESAIRLLGALGWAWEVRGHYSEARGWLERIRSLSDVEEYPQAYARLLNHIGRHSWSQGNLQDARNLLQESQAISHACGVQGESNLAEALNWLGLIVLFGDQEGDLAKALFSEALKRYHKLDEPWGIALSTFHLGVAELFLNNYAAALNLLEQSISVFRKFSDMFFMGRVSSFLGDLHRKQGDDDKSRYYFEQQLKIDQQIQFWNGIIDSWLEMGHLYRQRGEYEKARNCYEESLMVSSEHNLNTYTTFYMSGLISLYLDDYPLASQRFTHLLRQAAACGEEEHLGMILSGLAAVAGGTHQPKRSAKLLGAAQAIFEERREVIPASEWQEFDRHIQLGHEQLGAASFETIQAEGSAMKTEQAIEFALKTIDEPTRL